MPGDFPLEQHLRQLELQLLSPSGAFSDELAGLLADDFVEFGSSGKVYNKEQTIQTLLAASRPQRSLADFKVLSLAQDVALATYRAARHRASDEAPVYSLRSSVWKLSNGRWQMIFHQGTLSEPSAL